MAHLSFYDIRVHVPASPGFCCCSVTKSCLTLWGSMDYSMPGFPILHYLLEFPQIHVQWACDTIQPSHPVSSFFSCLQFFPASGSFPVNQLFTSDVQSVGVSTSASVLPRKIQGWFPLGLTGLISLLSEEFSRVFSSTTIWKHQYFGTQPSLWSISHISTRLLEKPQLWLYRPLSAKWWPLLFNTLSLS